MGKEVLKLNALFLIQCIPRGAGRDGSTVGFRQKSANTPKNSKRPNVGGKYRGTAEEGAKIFNHQVRSAGLSQSICDQSRRTLGKSLSSIRQTLSVAVVDILRSQVQ